MNNSCLISLYNVYLGAEVKSGTPLKVTPEEDNLIHLSQVIFKFPNSKFKVFKIGVKQSLDSVSLCVGNT